MQWIDKTVGVVGMPESIPSLHFQYYTWTPQFVKCSLPPLRPDYFSDILHLNN